MAGQSGSLYARRRRRAGKWKRRLTLAFVALVLGGIGWGVFALQGMVPPERAVEFGISDERFPR